MRAQIFFVLKITVIQLNIKLHVNPSLLTFSKYEKYVYSNDMQSKLLRAKFSNKIEYSQTLSENANHNVPINAGISLLVPTLKK